MSHDRRWQIFPAQPELTSQISQRLGCHPMVAQLLLNRKVSSLSDLRCFLDPELRPDAVFPDAYMMPVLALIHQAVAASKRILVYADYDVDGMTSTALMVPFLRSLGADPKFKLPHRFKDGYGLSMAQVAWMQTFDMVITLDCGVTNVKEIAAIVANGKTQVVVLDHHTIPDPLPPAQGMLNPKVLPENHALYGLCTAGLVYVFMKAYCAHYAYDYPLKSQLDLVALGTLADVAPLVGENRRFVSYGLRVLSQRKRPGLDALLRESEFDRSYVSARDVGFVIAPRLNAAGRLADPMFGAQILMTADVTEADNLARALCQMNMDRQAIGQAVLDESLKQIKEQALDQHSVLVLHGMGWHAGVIGIAASKLVERYSRPVVMISDTGELGRGSARTCGEVNIYQLLSAGSALFSKFGGHKEAAGFSILSERIPELREVLVRRATETLSPEALSPIVQIDATLMPSDVGLDLVEALQQLAPFGAANPTPVFYTNQWTPIDMRLVGKGKHVKVTFSTMSGDRVVDAIGFGLAHKLPALQQKNPELVFHLEVNTWGGTHLPQLQLVDVR
jgi:single-stranded-DNA-specific exonuclease